MNVLLLTNGELSSWSHEAAQALQAFGQVKVVNRRDDFEKVMPQGFRLILIDATGLVDTLGDVVAKMRRQAPKALIVVSAAAPTPSLARRNLLAGADDTITKSSREALLKRLQKLIQLPIREAHVQQSAYLA